MQTINISFVSDDWRGVALSNFALSPFVFDGQMLASVEGFIQGIKFPPGHPQRQQAFASWERAAQRCGQGAGRAKVFWQQAELEFGSAAHHALVARAIEERFAQNSGLCALLRSTQGLEITHITGEGAEPARTSLPAELFCRTLSAIRARC